MIPYMKMGTGTVIRNLYLNILLEFSNFSANSHWSHIGIHEKYFQFAFTFFPKFKSNFRQNTPWNFSGERFDSNRVEYSRNTQICAVEFGGMAERENFNLHISN